MIWDLLSFCFHKWGVVLFVSPFCSTWKPLVKRLVWCPFVCFLLCSAFWIPGKSSSMWKIMFCSSLHVPQLQNFSKNSALSYALAFFFIFFYEYILMFRSSSSSWFSCCYDFLNMQFHCDDSMPVMTRCDGCVWFQMVAALIWALAPSPLKK